MSEVRRNPLTGRSTIIAPARGKRPDDFRRRIAAATAGHFEKNCPFCPGNESLLPAVIAETPALNPGPDAPPWQTRLVPNKFAALRPDVEPQASEGSAPIIGRHEVIIETPRHDRHMAAMTAGEAAAVIESYLRRYRELSAMPETRAIVVFRNHGVAGGASLKHPHSQIVTVDQVPPGQRRREMLARRHFEDRQSCLLCGMMKREAADGRRMVTENQGFAAFVPFAAEVPFETWIAPRRHRADFGDIAAAEGADLASLLVESLRRLGGGLNDPDYNYVIGSSIGADTATAHLHWFLRIVPRLTVQAGFEVGAGMSINPSRPENDAAYLRRVVV